MKLDLYMGRKNLTGTAPESYGSAYIHRPLGNGH